ncbi:MAG: phosphotransferase [Acidimicrobiales bacterium]|nr:phosphotransferase [Acidimicrobiales bacterium]
MTLNYDWLARHLGGSVKSGVGLSGGDVAQSFRVDLTDGRAVFAKTNHDPPPHFFTTEATGLRWLSEPAAVRVPEVLAVADDPPILVLEWIETNPRRVPDERAFGRELAELHRAGFERFGRLDERTTGSRALPNVQCDDWVEFFAINRLEPLGRLTGDAGILDSEARAGLRTIVSRLADLAGPAESPARLHGDLWAGNRMVDRNGDSWLIDPASFGGHREFDLAMMRLFGGFGPDAFASYSEVFPLADGWEHRIQLWQLAPLLVHAIKFGGHYIDAAKKVIDRFT